MNARTDWTAHAVLGLGVLLFALPVWLVLAGSTQDAGAISRPSLRVSISHPSAAALTVASITPERSPAILAAPEPPLAMMLMSVDFQPCVFASCRAIHSVSASSPKER